MTAQSGYSFAGAVSDFWKSGVTPLLGFPDGINDQSEAIARSGDVGIGVAAPEDVAAKLDLAGAQVLRPINFPDFAVDGAIGLAPDTVDISSHLIFAQTTVGRTLTIPNPTNTQAGRILLMTNTGAAMVTVGGQAVEQNKGVLLVWNGAAWIPFGNYTAPADFWRTLVGATPDGTNDTTEAIRRLGHVGIGGAAVTDAMSTVNAPSATNNYLQLSAAAGNRGQLMYGNNPLNYYMTRTLPLAAGNYVDIGNLTAGAQSSTFVLTLNVSDGAFAMSKLYVGALVWHATGNAWRVLRPLVDSGPFNGNNFELLVNVNNGVASFRIRRTAGGNAGTVRIYLQSFGDPTTTLTESVATAADAAAYTTYDPFPFSNDFWRSGVGFTTLPDGTNDTTEIIARMGAVVIGALAQVLAAQLSVVSDTNVITDAIASFLANNLTQGVDIHWGGISKSGTNANGSISVNAKGNGDIILHGSPNGETASTGNVGVGVVGATAAKFDLNGAAVLRSVNVANLAANGSVGTAAATTDIASVLVLAQTTNNIALTLPNPTNTTAGRQLQVTHNGTATGVTIAGRQIGVGETVSFVWDGNTWNPPALIPKAIVLATLPINTAIPTAAVTVLAGYVETTDTANAFAAGVFTAPRAGFYQVNAAILFQAGAWVPNSGITIEIRVGGVLRIGNTNAAGGAALNAALSADISGVVSLNAGEQLTIAITQNSGAAKNSAAANYSYLSINEI